MYTNYFSSAKHEYTLMNKDVPLANFHLQDIESELFQISDIVPLTHSPYEGKRELHTLLNQRKPVKNREHLTKLLQIMQIHSISGYLNISYRLSLNDTLWFKPEGAPGAYYLGFNQSL